MNSEFIKIFHLQRQIFGICPNSGEFFRLSDCKIYPKAKKAHDWMDKLNLKEHELELMEESLEEKREEIKEKGRKKGRRLAQLAIKKIDPIFTPRALNPDDAKVIFHPIDYVIFNGMKNSIYIKSIVLLDRKMKSSAHRNIQRSIEKAVERGNYEWQTLRVKENGLIEQE